MASRTEASRFGSCATMFIGGILLDFGSVVGATAAGSLILIFVFLQGERVYIGENGSLYLDRRIATRRVGDPWTTHRRTPSASSARQLRGAAGDLCLPRCS